LGGLQTDEEEDHEECSDIEKREESGGSKSEIPIERGVAIERIERAAEDIRMANKKGQNKIPMRSVSV
jgi:hypothetical protein